MFCVVFARTRSRRESKTRWSISVPRLEFGGTVGLFALPDLASPGKRVRGTSRAVHRPIRNCGHSAARHFVSRDAHAYRDISSLDSTNTTTTSHASTPVHSQNQNPSIPQDDPTEKFAFVVEWFDPHSGLTRRYQFLFWPLSREVAMYDLKNKRAFLKKTQVPGLASADLFIGATVAVYSRQLKVVEFGDEFTESRFSISRQKTFAVVSETSSDSLGKIINALTKSGFAIASLKMSEGKGVGVSLVSDGAVDKLLNLLPELETHFGSGCVTVADDPATATAMELTFEHLPATAKLDGTTTLCLIKPSAMEHLGLVLDEITGNGFTVSGAKTFTLDRASALEFYEVYRGVAPEFTMMVDELTSGAFVAVEVSGDGGDGGDPNGPHGTVGKFREIVGPVDPEMARALRPQSMRAKFGFDKVRNAVHCTDLAEDGALETHYFFKILAQEA